ncbi:MAG: helix-turn-helix domain-containing protein [Planctomycetes bacterium]|nr:helix-turn-helix domain-containing protein [Planctomycetota bacterium]
MLDAGRLGCATATVARIRRLYRMGGIACIRPSRGRRSRHACLSQEDEAGCRHQSHEIGLRLFWSATRLAPTLGKPASISATIRCVDCCIR